MTRRQIREEIFKMIFQSEFHDADEMPKQMENFLGEKSNLGANREEIENKSNDILAHKTEIDEAINAAAEKWSTDRMSKVDLSIIRLATYEMKYEELSPAIAINEAVEIAKKYGSDNSASFVNGVLAKVK